MWDVISSLFSSYRIGLDDTGAEKNSSITKCNNIVSS